MFPTTARARHRADAAQILRLSGPLLVNNLATAGMTTADTVMAGRLGAVELAAVALGANYVSFFYLGGLGLLMALSPTVAHAVGGGRDREAGGFFRQALWLSLAVSAIVLVGLAFVHPVLRAVGTAPEVAALAARYVLAVAFGLPAMFAFLALRFSSEGIGWTRPILFTAVLAFGANVFGNWVFIHGRFGAPALGAVGCGVATALTQWLILGVLWTYIRRHLAYARFQPLARFERPAADVVARALAERGIAVRSFPARPGLERCLRITCPAESQHFERLCAALVEACSASVTTDRVSGEPL